MARNESKALAGFYPFPKRLLPALASLVAACPPASRWSRMQPLQIVDPFAGSGEAVLGLCSAWRHFDPLKAGAWRDKKAACLHSSPQFDATLIELEHQRFAEASGAVELAASTGTVITTSRVLSQDSYRWLRRGPDRWASIVYLNPPYDTHPVHGREEAAALLHWLPQMVDGGVLIGVFPAAALAACAPILAAHTREGDLKFRRLPDPEFAIYEQVVFVAAVSSSVTSRPERAATIAKFGEFAEDMLPDLEIEPAPLVAAPAPRICHGTWIYRAVRPEAVAPLIRPFERVRGVTVPIDQMVGRRVQLAMPPRPAHIVMALVDGAFDGQEIRSPRPGLPAVLVKAVSGRSLLATSEEEQVKAGKQIVVAKYVEVPSLRLYVMDLERIEFFEPPAASLPSGATALRDMNIADFVQAYAEPLADLMAELFEPLHNSADDAQLVPLPPFARQLYPAQHHATSAALKLLCRQRSAMFDAQVGTGKTTMAIQVWGSLRPDAPMEVLGPRATFAPRHQIAEALNAAGHDPARLPVAERMLVMCPPHLLRSWAKEAAASLPAARVVEIRELSDLLQPADVYILSRERAKLGHGWRGVERLTCSKCGRPATIPSWKRKRPIAPEDLADARATCTHLELPRSPIWRAVDHVAQALHKYAPTSTAGLWASERHPALARAQELLERQAIARYTAADPTYEVPEGERPNIGPFLPKLIGADAQQMMGREVKIALRAAGAQLLAYNPEAPFELAASELAVFIKDLGRAAIVAGWSIDQYRAEVDRRVFFLPPPAADPRWPDRPPVKISPKLGSWRGVVQDAIARNYEFQAVGSALTIWGTVFVQLLEVAKKFAGEPSRVCGEPLYGAEPKPRRYSIAKWAIRYLPTRWWRSTMLVIDEAHEMSNGESAQSQAGQRMAGRAGSVLLLTGSLMSGYARSLYRNLRMASPRFCEDWQHQDEERFVNGYGYSKFREVYEVTRGPVARGKNSDRRETDGMVRTGDAPGVAPGAVLRHVLPVAAVVHQGDLNLNIPPLYEHEVAIETDERDAEMLDEWASIELQLLKAMSSDMRLRRKLLWAVLKIPTYPDLGCEDVNKFIIQMPVDDDYPDAPRETIVVAKLMPASYVTPKERWLLDFFPVERNQGRRTIVFVSHTGGGYPARLSRLLAGAGVSSTYLDVKRVPTQKRDEWIERHAADVEVLICNPNAVRTGLNSLVAFNNTVWLEHDWDPRTWRQGNGRIHRIGQREVAHAYYLYLPNSGQSDALALIKAKVGASLGVDGLDVASSLAMAGASEEQIQAAAVYDDVAAAIYKRTMERRKICA